MTEEIFGPVLTVKQISDISNVRSMFTKTVTGTRFSN